ncbi:hypothetical protein BN1708_019350, partial [Verticillium longisporum]
HVPVELCHGPQLHHLQRHRDREQPHPRPHHAPGARQHRQARQLALPPLSRGRRPALG